MENSELRAEAAIAAKAKMGLYIHLVVYVLVNAGLIGINLVTSPEHIWFVWPLLGWGIGVVFHTVLFFAYPKISRLKERMIAREMEKQSAHKP